MTNRQISPHTASFEKIFREYYPVLLPFVERHVGERELAKDLVQDVFLKLYKSYPYFSSEVNIKSWLYTSSRNAALDYLRHLKVRDNNKLLMAEAMMYAADVDEVISEELTRKIHEAIDSLPLQCCQIRRHHRDPTGQLLRRPDAGAPLGKSHIHRHLAPQRVGGTGQIGAAVPHIAPIAIRYVPI